MDFQMPLLSHLTMLSSRERLVYGLKVLLGYQRILDPRGTQTLEGRMSKKKKRAFVKVKEGGVHHKKYDGHCTKQ